jgi:tetraacyldisaccharide 4'-kinase
MVDAHWLWSSRSPAARLARTALLPAAGAFRVIAAVRNAAYDAGVFAAHPLPVPSIGVGNLSLGGTGKTPVAHWLAERLAAAGATPGILLRGYGDDEGAVHRALSPGRIVVENADRLTGGAAAVSAGADVLVLDDAFQHRRVARTRDVVLISADAASEARWPFPAGPWREPAAALARAHLVLVTRKGVSGPDAANLAAELQRRFTGLPVGIAHIAPRDLVRFGHDERVPLEARAGQTALVVSGIGNPAAFEAQVRAAGLTVRPIRFRDHHRYSADDAATIERSAAGSDLVICTLKDALKLGPLWQRGWAPLWYLSQRISLDRGEDSVAELLAAVLAARSTPAPPPNR